MSYIEPYAHMVSRTTDDYERLAFAVCEALCEPAYWAGFDRSKVIIDHVEEHTVAHLLDAGY